ncbi:MAG: hypothetical protein K2N22_07170 [Clostridia bacterium]|nr:hypothetical protein [Clostridia bacterium]
MKKTIGIDLSSDRLISLAADMVEEHNYIGALKMLNKNAELHCNDADSYMLYAEIFDDIELYEKCVNGWFKFIDCAEAGELSEAYEGLAVAYMNLGNEHLSAYYYNKLLIDTDDLDAEARGEIISSFLSRDENPLKFVYPPQLADYSEVISNGIEQMKLGEYEKAVEEFEKVDEENESFRSARNYIAMCDIICDKCDEAEAECLAILKKYPDNVQALTTLAAVKTEQKKSEESKQLAQKLLSLDVKGSDDIYKIATVCCENKMHEEAYKLFCKLEQELFYDSSVIYFKAVSAYNCGKYDECFAAFDKLLTVYPESVTARYFYNAARAGKDGELPELSYFYRLPQEQREKNLIMLAAFAKLPKKGMKKLFNVLDLSECVRWCFDETDVTSSDELRFLAAECAVKAGLDGVLCDLLLNAFLPDELKVHILTLIGERNEDNSFGVTVCNLYKRVTFRALRLGRFKRKHFVTAYARLTSHFSIIDDDYGDEFARSAEELYAKLEAEGRLGGVDINTLSAAIYFYSGVKEQSVTRENLCEFFETTEEKLNLILGDL